MITSLFELYTDFSANNNGQLLPPDYRPNILSSDTDITKRKKFAKAASDYIAGMMDTYAIECYETLFDRPFGSIEI